MVQHKEGVITGMSIEKKINVVVNGQTIEATAFTTNPARASLQGPVSEDYVEALIRGATQSGLPASYIESIPSRAK